jgi:trans-aconitate methyltransferase
MAQTTSWNPKSYAANARFVSALGEPLLELLAAKPGELILDLGCGDGALTEKIAGLKCRVYSVDASFAQVEAAKKRGLDALVMDGHQLCFKERFDAVFTNAALHWMKQPERVIAGAWSSLKTEGRFIGEFGGKGNVAIIQSALHAAMWKRGIDPLAIDPWYYPAPEEYAQLLTAGGFTMNYMEVIPRPTRLPGDILAWLEVFAQPFTKSVRESERPEFLQEIRSRLEFGLRDSEGNWIADYVRLRFRAVK